VGDKFQAVDKSSGANMSRNPSTYPGLERSFTYDCGHIAIETSVFVHGHGEFEQEDLVSTTKTIWDMLAFGNRAGTGGPTIGNSTRSNISTISITTLLSQHDYNLRIGRKGCIGKYLGR
jgi:hypothetical protein